MTLPQPTHHLVLDPDTLERVESSNPQGIHFWGFFDRKNSRMTVICELWNESILGRSAEPGLEPRFWDCELVRLARKMLGRSKKSYGLRSAGLRA